MAKTKAKPAKKPAVKAKSKSKPAAKSKPKAKAKSKPAAKAKSGSKPKEGSKAKPSKLAKVGRIAAAVAGVGVTAAAAALAAKNAKKLGLVTKPQATSQGKTAKLENISAIFSPLDDRLIIEALVDADRTPGGLFIPDTVGASDRPKQGKVLAVGRGHQTKKGRIQRLDVQLGDTVLFEAYLGQPLKIGQRDCLVIRESQLLGIIRS